MASLAPREIGTRGRKPWLSLTSTGHNCSPQDCNVAIRGLLHDGLLISPLPTQTTLARLHHEALAKLQLITDDNPFLLIHSHQEAYSHIVHQLPLAAPRTQQALEAAMHDGASPSIQVMSLV